MRISLGLLTPAALVHGKMIQAAVEKLREIIPVGDRALSRVQPSVVRFETGLLS